MKSQGRHPPPCHPPPCLHPRQQDTLIYIHCVCVCVLCVCVSVCTLTYVNIKCLCLLWINEAKANIKNWQKFKITFVNSLMRELKLKTKAEGWVPIFFCFFWQRFFPTSPEEFTGQGGWKVDRRPSMLYIIISVQWLPHYHICDIYSALVEGGKAQVWRTSWRDIVVCGNIRGGMRNHIK
jgi:hypothetical protein